MAQNKMCELSIKGELINKVEKGCYSYLSCFFFSKDGGVKIDVEN